MTVHVADGVYYLPETLVFTAADSGTTYQADHEGAAVISGGFDFTGGLDWKTDGKIWQAPTPKGFLIDQLFINGKRQHMARYPNYDPNQPTAAYQGFAADVFSKERAAK